MLSYPYFWNPLYKIFAFQITQISKLAVRRELNPQETLVKAGEISEYFYILTRGSIERRSSGKMSKLILTGQSIGLFELFLQRTRVACDEHKSALSDQVPQEDW